MFCSIPLFELVLELEKKEFKKQLKRVEKAGHELQKTKYGYTDETLAESGISIVYDDGSKRKSVRLLVSPSDVIDDDLMWETTPDNASKLCAKLEKLIASHFHSEYKLKDFELCQMSFEAEMDVGTRATDYFKMLNSIGKVRCFQPMKSNDDKSFGFISHTKFVEFYVRGLKGDKETLCAEVRLTSRGSIRAYSDKKDTEKQIGEIIDKSERIFMDTFEHIVPYGDCHKKPRTEKLIYKGVPGGKIRKKMLKLVALIPLKKSMLLAIKALNFRDIGEVMEKFAEIGVSPVTIKKRASGKKLKSLHDCFIEI